MCADTYRMHVMRFFVLFFFIHLFIYLFLYRKEESGAIFLEMHAVVCVDLLQTM